MAATAARKTFSGQSKKKGIVPHAREPNGRYQRPPKEESDAARIEFIAAQPHRRGLPAHAAQGEMGGSAVGRLIASKRISHELWTSGYLFDAAEVYLTRYTAWAKIKESRNGLGKTVPGSGLIDEELARQKIQDYTEIRKAVADAGDMALKAVESVVLEPTCDDRVLPFWVIYSLPIGLAAIAEHLRRAKTR